MFTGGGAVVQHAMGQGCVSQHTMEQGVCIPACNWAGGVTREGVTGGCVCPEGGHPGLNCPPIQSTSRWYVSYWNAFLLPPATKLGQGNIFTGNCDSVHRGGLPQCMLGYHTHTPRPGRHPPLDQAGTPPEQSILGDTVNERAVCILLECNLVRVLFWWLARITLLSRSSFSGWPHSSQDKIPCVFPVLDNFSLCYFYVINNS